MNRPFRTASSAVVLALGLAACGGGTPGSLPTTAPLQASQGRAQQGLQTGCTPDSYGYCYKTGSTTYAKTTCQLSSGLVSYPSRAMTTYQVFDAYGDWTYYTKTVWPECNGALSYTTWSPNEPRAVTGDPNLP
jgi:hypothetical protein